MVLTQKSFFCFTAFKYEIRCYTKRRALNEPVFTGILVHDSFLPEPLQYGSKQSCKVGVPWPNEVFYYGLVAIDEAGNRSPISNIISVYIYEPPTTTTTTTTPSTTILRTNSIGKLTFFKYFLARRGSSRTTVPTPLDGALDQWPPP